MKILETYQYLISNELRPIKKEFKKRYFIIFINLGDQLQTNHNNCMYLIDSD